MSRYEKAESLAPLATPTIHVGSSSRVLRLLSSCVIVTLGLIAVLYHHDSLRWSNLTTMINDAGDSPLCYQTSAINPSNDTLLQLLETDLASGDFQTNSAKLLGAAVTYPTHPYDDMGEIGEDTRWDMFIPWHEWLERAFPTLHSRLRKETVNTYGLVYTWEGSDKSLKPVMFTAHQDTVPVFDETLDEWEHPPFSGFFDGKWIWGRGSVDCKSAVVGLMIAVERLLVHDFHPTRTVVLAFGFDEESSGFRGAANINRFLVGRYGHNGLAMVIDEGFGLDEFLGQVYATPGVSEKGYLDVHIMVNTTGGHSAVPPAHTSIGILSALITTLEDKPHPRQLTRINPLYDTLQCIAKYSPDVPEQMRRTVERSRVSDKALKEVAEWVSTLPTGRMSGVEEQLLYTTQATTIFHAGVKANALPQTAWSLTNHRIAVDSSTAAVKDRIARLLLPKIESFNLSLTAFGKTLIDGPRSGSVVLSDAWNTGHDPAPVSPTSGAAWDLLSGTIQGVYARSKVFPAPGPKNVVVIPAAIVGATDARHYRDLSPHVYNYGQFRPDLLRGSHGVNEAMEVTNWMGYIEYFATVILTVDEARNV